MFIALPGPVAAYFAAEEAGDADALARCFAEHGVVRDEGGTFKGVTAIREWNPAPPIPRLRSASAPSAWPSATLAELLCKHDNDALGPADVR